MRKYNILIATIVFTLSLVFINNSNNYASALSYESEVGIGFTFNPTLSISISSSDLIISNLVPGSSSDSNIINVSVLTNASHGYTLATDTSSKDLVHSNNINTFSSIATDADLASLTTDNTWGYSYKLSSNNTWSNYSGLPLHTNTSTTLINTDNQVSKPIDFKIGAKASSTQASGTYTGTINFIAVSKPTPKTIDDIVYMQTFGELVSTDLQSVKNSMVLNQDYILKDARDEKEYYVTRLEDGNVWMTQNLDLDLSSGILLTSNDTDLNDTISTAYQDGYTINDSIIYWRPINNTVTDLSEWIISTDEPSSYDIGEMYANYSSISPNQHNLAGNYYNQSAAIASNNLGNNSAKNLTNSICPKGWRLPDASPGKEFSKLFFAYGITKDSDDSTGYADNTGFTKIISSPLWFSTAGDINNGSLNYFNNYGFYRSSSLASSRNAYYLFFYSGNVYLAIQDSRSVGLSIRCLAR